MPHRVGRRDYGSAIRKNEVTPRVWMSGKVICKGAAGIVGYAYGARRRAAAVVTLSAKVKSRTRVFGGGCLPYDRRASRSHPPTPQDRSCQAAGPFGPAATMISTGKILR